MRFFVYILLVNMSLLCSFYIASAQLSKGGIPLSSEIKLKQAYQEIEIKHPTADELWGNEKYSDKINLPHPFARIIPVNLTPYDAGTWTDTQNGFRIWRLKLRTEGALALGLYFSDFYLPAGVRLFIYNKDQEHLLGAYTNDNNRKSGLFATEITGGDQVTLELNVPNSMHSDPMFTITGMDYAYRSVPSFKEGDLILSSGDCEVNINCTPEGDLWQEVKRGIVRIKVKIGLNAYWCTGSLINNTAIDYTPYILTADHCAFKTQYATPQQLEQWIFYFNYESENCESTNPVSSGFSMTGAFKVAHGGERGNSGSDFYLVRLMEDIPADHTADVFFNGWSRYNVISESGVTIHHPAGDIKKISTYTQPVASTGWQNNGLESHWKVTWSETENGWGVTEGGSSGCPLFDNDGRIRGTLTGGLASCDATSEPDYYGKFSYHWDSNGDSDSLQLGPWLDPLKTNQYDLGGFVQPDLTIDFKMYPTIAASELTLETVNVANPELEISFTNYTGQLVKKETVNFNDSEYKYDISDLSSGFYVVKVTFDGYTYINKIVKK